MEADANEPKLEQQREGGPPFWEWAIAGVGLVLLLASVAYFAWFAGSGPVATPAPRIEVTGIEQQGARYVVLVRVRNPSRSPVAELKVTGTLKRQGNAVEETETQFAFIPGASLREGALFFTRNPREFELELAPKSFQKP